VVVPGQKPNLDFRIKIVRAVTVSKVVFADLLTRRTIVSAYMKNNTPSCDRQNASLAEVYAEMDRAGYNLVAVSRDTAGSQARYAAANRVEYTLVSDPKDLFAQAVDSLVPKSMYGRSFVGPMRAAFVFKHDGTVLAVAEKVDTANHAHQLRELIKSL
jgi:peroxiredoxin Q/BCP